MLRSFGFELVKYQGWLDRLAILKGDQNSQNKVRQFKDGEGGETGAQIQKSV